MPYEFRQLTPDARAAVVDARRRQGFPLHAPPHPYRGAGWYLLSAANFEHKPVMHNADRREEFERRLLAAFSSIEADIGGWVILPNHYHILAGIDSLETVSGLVKHLHGTTSREWNLADGVTGRRRVWYRFSDRGIRDEQHYYQALNYLHYNPVKHGYVQDPYLWPMSSIFVYYDTKGRKWLRNTWKDYPVGDFGVGWDD